eukprot:360675-Chlamydomonas_euryale.AAC.4
MGTSIPRGHCLAVGGGKSTMRALPRCGGGQVHREGTQSEAFQWRTLVSTVAVLTCLRVCACVDSTC